MQIFKIDTSSNPQIKDFCEIIANAIGVRENVVISRLSHAAVIQRLQDGKLKGIEENMKISKSNFYHFYTEGTKEVIVQLSSDRLAVFSDQ